MRFRKFAGWLCLSSAFCLLPVLAQPPIQIQTQNGSTVSFPSGFDQVVRPHDTGKSEVVIGFQTASQVRVVFVHTTEKIPFQPEKILGEALQLDRIHLEPVRAEFAQGIHRNPIHRILSTEGYDNLFLAFDRRYYHGGSTFFFLLGSDKDFFEFVPLFETMVDKFKPTKPHFPRGIADISAWTILAAIGLLAVNTWVIFSCFKEMAHIAT